MKRCIANLVFVSLFSLIYSQTKPVIEWVDIPAGSFVIGSPENELNRNDDETHHLVTVSAFKMSKYEITFDQYDAFCKATGYQYANDLGYGRGNMPVLNVSWRNAQAFAVWMGCRLPTEAEWEYACRAGTTTTFYTGNCINTNQGNFNGNLPYFGCKKEGFRKRPLPVGSFEPNAWGLYDMHGNVAEWCNDWYEYYNSTEQVNPVGSEKGSLKVVRGGGWSGSAARCRSAVRGINIPVYFNDFIGFRLVSE